jgi:ABC-type antimicrobial peptide transport system permease subunit
VLGGVGRVLLAGLAVGVALSVALVRLLDTMLFGVEPLDPLTFLIVLAVLGVTTMVAVAGPAWKATRVDPVVALRTE